MGAPKPLLPLAGKPMIRHVIDTVARIADPIIVVTGPTDLSSCLDDVLLVANPRYRESGMLVSIQMGIRALPVECNAVLIALADHPLVQPETIDALVEMWAHTGTQIVRPRFEGARGHPILLDRACFERVLSLGPDQTLKSIFTGNQHAAVDVEVDDLGILIDIDTPDDYARVCQRSATCTDAMTVAG